MTVSVRSAGLIIDRTIFLPQPTSQIQLLVLPTVSSSHEGLRSPPNSKATDRGRRCRTLGSQYLQDPCMALPPLSFQNPAALPRGNASALPPPPQTTRHLAGFNPRRPVQHPQTIPSSAPTDDTQFSTHRCALWKTLDAHDWNVNVCENTLERTGS